MRKKHPTLGKRALAERYFLRKDESKAIIDGDSPILENNTNKEFLKFKSHK